MSIFIITGCIPVLTYTPRVCEPGELMLSASASNFYNTYYSNMEEQQFLFFSFLGKVGLPNHFDIGLEVQTTFFPFLLSGSIRKQFDFKNSFIQGLSFGASYGIFYNEQLMFYSSIITKNVSFVSGIAKQRISIGETYTDGENSIFVQALYETELKKIHVAPYLYANITMHRSNEENVFYLKSFFDRENIERSYTVLGFGIIIYIAGK